MRSKMNGVVDGPRGMPQISYPPAPPDEGAAFTSTNPMIANDTEGNQLPMNSGLIPTEPELLAGTLVAQMGSSEAVVDLLRSTLDFLDVSAKLNKTNVTFALDESAKELESATERTEFAEEEYSRKAVEELRARTMFNMVEDIDDGKCKLLFLTNSQADLIASSSLGVQKMLDALEVPKPSLVIELLMSWGFRGTTELFPEEFYRSSKPEHAGLLHRRPPFLNYDDERQAEAKLDMFMADVIIPLASQTNAIVLCAAVPGDCALSSSFLRMYAVMKAKWGGRTPFTVLSLTNAVDFFYQNDAEDANWKAFRRSSRAWRQRDQLLLDKFGLKEGEAPGNFDIDKNSSIVIMTDCINPKTEKKDKKPLDSLQQALVRHLSSSVPSLAIRTGLSTKYPLGSPELQALDIVTARANAGTPVLALDVRDRPSFFKHMEHIGTRGSLGSAEKRQDLINHAKQTIDAWRQELLGDDDDDDDDENDDDDEEERTTEGKKDEGGQAISGAAGNGRSSSKGKERKEKKKKGKKSAVTKYRKSALVETLDVCTLAYLHEVLKSDGARAGSGGEKRGLDTIPLHEAIKDAQDEEKSKINDGTMAPATPAQIAAVARWHVDRVFKDAWAVREDVEAREASGETFNSFYGDRLFAQEIHARTLLSSPNFFHANLSDLEGAQKLVNRIVRLDRLPSTNPLQGLLLLRDAWRDYDVAMLLAERYKFICKAIFALQLLVSFLVVIGSNCELDDLLKGHNVHAVFALAVLFSILVSLDGMLNPKARWRHLRSSAMALHSIIWRYRTRTGDFELDEAHHSSRPENVLCAVLNEWRVNLLAGAGMKRTNLMKSYPPRVYRHFQYEGSPQSPERLEPFEELPNVDDHQSPTQPTLYIELRIEPMLGFYTRRIPKYSEHGFTLKLVILLFGVAASVLAHYDVLAWVMASTAAASGFTSWAEFSEDAYKVERYTSAVNRLSMLLSWWSSLGEVEKASRESITHLVLEAESIISEEQQAWTSTSAKQDAAVQESGQKESQSLLDSSKIESVL